MKPPTVGRYLHHYAVSAAGTPTTTLKRRDGPITSRRVTALAAVATGRAGLLRGVLFSTDLMSTRVAGCA